MKVSCPYCGLEYEIQEDMFGRKAECGNCGKKFILGQAAGGSQGGEGLETAHPECPKAVDQGSAIAMKRPIPVLLAYIAAFSTGVLLMLVGCVFMTNQEGELDWGAVFLALTGVANFLAACHLYIGHKRAIELSIVAAVLSIASCFFVESVFLVLFAAWGVFHNLIPSLSFCFSGTRKWVSQYPNASHDAWAMFVAKVKKLSTLLKITWLVIAFALGYGYLHGDRIACFISALESVALYGWAYIADGGGYLICDNVTYNKRQLLLAVNSRESRITVAESLKENEKKNQGFTTDGALVVDDQKVYGNFNVSSDEEWDGFKKLLRGKVHERTYHSLVRKLEKYRK